MLSSTNIQIENEKSITPFQNLQNVSVRDIILIQRIDLIWGYHTILPKSISQQMCVSCECYFASSSVIGMIKKAIS